MDSRVTKVFGENGAAELSSTSDPRLDLFFALVRDLPADRLCRLVNNCFTSSVVRSEEMAVDMFVLAFQTRDCRGGKGERSLFIKLFLELASRFPKTAVGILPLIPEYGYYKDLFLIAGHIIENDFETLLPISQAVLQLAADQLLKDLTAQPKDVSLLAKWAPREKSSQGSLARLLAEKMFPQSKTARAQYRKALSKLNASLGTVEVHMCSHAWDQIEPTAVPSLCLTRHRKAFLNEKLDSGPSRVQLETGNRFPDDKNRVACRTRVREALVSTGEKKLKGKQLFPHEITRLLMDYSSKSSLEMDIFNAQWQSIRTATEEALTAKRAETAGSETPSLENRVDLGKLVALVDVSASMSGIPMEVAIALGILVSELADPAFANRVITFDENPTWCTFEADASIADKVQIAQSAPWGGSTDFEKAMELILDVAVNAKLTPEEIPNLIVFSDMQFNEASSHTGYYSDPYWSDSSSPRQGGDSWETHHERIVRRFAEAGVKVCGKPYPAPEITYWNLRGNTVGFPVDANAPSVRMLSGFSPSLLKLMLSGESLDEMVIVGEEVVEDGEVVAVRKRAKVDPLSTLRKALDDPKYDKVRAILSDSSEGVLSTYNFVEPPPVHHEAEDGVVV